MLDSKIDKRILKIYIPIDKLENLYNNHFLGVRQLAKIFYVSTKVIRDRLKENKISMLDRNPSSKFRKGKSEIECPSCLIKVSVFGDYSWSKNKCRKCYEIENRIVRKSENKNKIFDADNYPKTMICKKCLIGKEICNFRFRRDIFNFVTSCKKCERDECRIRHLERKKTEPQFKLRQKVSERFREGLKKTGSKKNDSTWKKLPYTPEQLRIHIELLWEPWMNWENHGAYDKDKQTWHVDHIIPHSSLPYNSLDDSNFQKCWALENLRPLEALKNLQKSNSKSYE